MPKVPITKKTAWECQCCGRCCHDIIMHKGKTISMLKNHDNVCKFFNHESNLCSNYPERPFICRIYPLIINLDVILDSDGIAHPMRALSIDNMTIHTECPGYGKGKPIRKNKNLQRKLNKLAHDFALRFKECHEKDLSVDEII